MQGGVVPSNDVGISGMELSVTWLRQLVMVVLQDMPDVHAVSYDLVPTTYAGLNLFPTRSRKTHTSEASWLKIQAGTLKDEIA